MILTTHLEFLVSMQINHGTCIWSNNHMYSRKHWWELNLKLGSLNFFALISIFKFVVQYRIAIPSFIYISILHVMLKRLVNSKQNSIIFTPSLLPWRLFWHYIWCRFCGEIDQFLWPENPAQIQYFCWWCSRRSGVLWDWNVKQCRLRIVPIWGLPLYHCEHRWKK